MTYKKDPNEVLDFGFDWSSILKNEEFIATSVWELSGDETVTLITSSNDATTATVWLSGGTVGATVKATNRITTTNSPSRTHERSLFVSVQDR